MKKSSVKIDEDDHDDNDVNDTNNDGDGSGRYQ